METSPGAWPGGGLPPLSACGGAQGSERSGPGAVSRAGRNPVRSGRAGSGPDNSGHWYGGKKNDTQGALGGAHSPPGQTWQRPEDLRGNEDCGDGGVQPCHPHGRADSAQGVVCLPQGPWDGHAPGHNGELRDGQPTKGEVCVCGEPRY